MKFIRTKCTELISWYVEDKKRFHSENFRADKMINRNQLYVLFAKCAQLRCGKKRRVKKFVESCPEERGNYGIESTKRSFKARAIQEFLNEVNG